MQGERAITLRVEHEQNVGELVTNGVFTGAIALMQDLLRNLQSDGPVELHTLLIKMTEAGRLLLPFCMQIGFHMAACIEKV